MPLSGPNPLVTPKWVNQHLNDSSIVILDCRFNLADLHYGLRQYNEGHIPGAQFVDIERDLSGIKGTHGGRHPLPSPSQFAALMGGLGISQETTVVGYDEDGMGAARLWWLLRYFGHERALVLNGGYHLWIRQGYPTTNIVPTPSPVTFSSRPDTSMVLGAQDIRDRLDRTILVDARSGERYRGESEPLDPKPGHIPGALNIEWQSLLSGPARYLPLNQLRARFEALPPNPVVYCGSGVSACVDILAMTLTGMEPILYPGSWSDWVSYPENPVATGDGW